MESPTQEMCFTEPSVWIVEALIIENNFIALLLVKNMYKFDFEHRATLKNI